MVDKRTRIIIVTYFVIHNCTYVYKNTIIQCNRIHRPWYWLVNEIHGCGFVCHTNWSNSQIGERYFVLPQRNSQEMNIERGRLTSADCCLWYSWFVLQQAGWHNEYRYQHHMRKGMLIGWINYRAFPLLSSNLHITFSIPPHPPSLSLSLLSLEGERKEGREREREKESFSISPYLILCGSFLSLSTILEYNGLWYAAHLHYPHKPNGVWLIISNQMPSMSRQLVTSKYSNMIDWGTIHVIVVSRAWDKLPLEPPNECGFQPTPTHFHSCSTPQVSEHLHACLL